MYPWNQPGAAAVPPRAARTAPARTAPGRRPSTAPARRAAEALQVALDRRDNGGESPAASGQ